MRWSGAGKPITPASKGVASGNISAAYSYLANSPLVEQVVFKQGANTRMTTTKSYDRLNRLSKISSVPSVSSAVSFEYAYNNAHAPP
jgi:hypothetical protein